MLGAIAAHYVDSEPGGASYVDKVMTLSPLAWYRHGEASGTVMVDSSGHGRHGTYSGSYTLGAPGLVAGDPDTAVALVSSGTSAAASAWLNVPHAGIGIRFATTGTGQQYLAGRWLSASNGHMFIDLQPSNVIRVYALIGGVTRIASATVLGLRDGNPHSAWATYDGAVLRLYVDGVQVATFAVVGSLSTTASTGLTIGHRSDTGSGTFVGTVDETIITDYAPTADQIAEIHAAGVAA